MQRPSALPFPLPTAGFAAPVPAPSVASVATSGLALPLPGQPAPLTQAIQAQASNPFPPVHPNPLSASQQTLSSHPNPSLAFQQTLPSHPFPTPLPSLSDPAFSQPQQAGAGGPREDGTGSSGRDLIIRIKRRRDEPAVDSLVFTSTKRVRELVGAGPAPPSVAEEEKTPAVRTAVWTRLDTVGASQVDRVMNDLTSRQRRRDMIREQRVQRSNPFGPTSRKDRAISELAQKHAVERFRRIDQQRGVSMHASGLSVVDVEQLPTPKLDAVTAKLPSTFTRNASDAVPLFTPQLPEVNPVPAPSRRTVYKPKPPPPNARKPPPSNRPDVFEELLQEYFEHEAELQEQQARPEHWRLNQSITSSSSAFAADHRAAGASHFKKPGSKAHQQPAHAPGSRAAPATYAAETKGQQESKGEAAPLDLDQDGEFVYDVFAFDSEHTHSGAGAAAATSEVAVDFSGLVDLEPFFEELVTEKSEVSEGFFASDSENSNDENYYTNEYPDRDIDEEEQPPGAANEDEDVDDLADRINDTLISDDEEAYDLEETEAEIEREIEEEVRKRFEQQEEDEDM